MCRVLAATFSGHDHGATSVVIIRVHPRLSVFIRVPTFTLTELMLSRVASNLYWLSRYVERAENTARVLDVAWRMSLLVKEPRLQDQEWFAPLNITGTLFPFSGRHSTVCAKEVLHFMALDPENPSSIRSCAQHARENARAIRGSITSEMWEVLNGTWLEMQQMDEEQPQRPRHLVVLRLGQGEEPPLPRRHLRHDAPRRRLPLHAAGHAHGARRLDGADPGREVPHPAAEREGCRRRGGLLPVVRGAALGVRLRGLPQGLPGRDHAACGWPNSSSCARTCRGACTSACARCRTRSTSCATTAPPRRCARPGRSLAQLRYGRISDIFATGLHEYLTDYLDAMQELSAQIQKSFFAPTLVD